MKGSKINKSSFRSLFSGVLPFFMLAHFGHHLLTALPVPLLPMIRSEFALDYTRSGFVISAFSLSYGISQLPAGWLADHIGRRIMITVGICGVALFGLLVGLSHTYTMMIVFLVLMGVIGGGYHPSAPPIISASVELKNRGRALGLHLVGGSASYFLAPLIAATIAIAWGWRGPFIALAIPAIIFGILFYVLLGRWASTNKAARRITSSQDQAPPVPGRWHHLAAFITLGAFTQATTISVMSFIPLFLVDHFGVKETIAGASVALFYSAGLWASPLGGYLSDRLGRMPLILVSCLVSGPVIFLLNPVSYGLGIAAVLVLIGVTTYIRAAASEAYVVSQTSEHNRSTVLGIYYFGFMEGSGILTPVMGYLIDHLGFYYSFTIASATIVVVTLVCSIWLWGSRD